CQETLASCEEKSLVTLGKKAPQATDIAAVLDRYRAPIEQGMREAVTSAAQATTRATATETLLASLYGQIEYHLGWVDSQFAPTAGSPGKLLRSTLTLLAADLAGGAQAVERAIPAAVSVELIHNFSLIHDDIEDGDDERRHRATLWRVWGQAQAINTGDALFSLARRQLLGLARRGVNPALTLRLAERVDTVCLELCEGQHLDMTFESRRDVTVAMYLDMIARKTAALMRCATELGARIGAPDDEALGDRLGDFGQALGLAFQIRDDLLGIWQAQELGKTAAGDVRRKKMSLPVIHALEHATDDDRAALTHIYFRPGPASDEQIVQALGILERSGARERARSALHEQLARARASLDSAIALAQRHPAGASQAAASALGEFLAYIGADAGA
ncbi:MAG TPA: polyprenyl synthetase family protein, partial [Ktedonobacterales bacterium]